MSSPADQHEKQIVADKNRARAARLARRIDVELIADPFGSWVRIQIADLEAIAERLES